mmetsp:Transcript_7847/g.24566  ORF Transcript_7847/g.24566 Transcript_7847/m.24566 type:complete len:266 (-) Transcript_7847:101-898(-)|eukprot:CAMPEP_0185294116 /NCGR_PEP_ID=MMETSP1363-20130426/7370_1 /TAXON_ID=38817 /ORGANISM="Gephyrocapsa oceanica, Strain RCC1303" /LENGTH=265 /DNA_ID=CAMNT_0027890545 /DNA_START=76 /DNA_END=873 /DNA_ORIENTATION=-
MRGVARHAMRGVSNHKMCGVCIVVLLALNASAQDSATWTMRLGRRQRDVCQESTGLLRLLSAMWGWVSGSEGGPCEVREAVCDDSLVTGLSVRNSATRLKGSDRDFYDFKLQCSGGWTSRWMGLRFEGDGDDVTKSMACPGEAVTGIEVIRGRVEKTDRDYLEFKMRCGRRWTGLLGLPFEGGGLIPDSRTATCPKGCIADGLRVTRGFQDWGDVDSYDMQLRCRCLDAAKGEGEGAVGQKGPTLFEARAIGDTKRLVDEVKREL